MTGRIKSLLPTLVDGGNYTGRSRLFTPEMLALFISLVESMPYQKAADLLNQIQHRGGKVKFISTTLGRNITSWGAQIHQSQLQQAGQALQEYGFDPETGHLKPGQELSESITNPFIPSEEAEKAARQYGKSLQEYMLEYPETPLNIDDVLSNLECPGNSVFMMIDDVSVNRQKEERSIGDKKGRKEAQTVINTVVWIRSPEGTYVIAAENTRQGLLMSLGYMLKNRLLENRELLVFFDGAKNIRTNVEEIFSFHKPLRLFLDWYHVCRRLSENLSMALKCGKENRDKNQEYIREILKKLWFNKVDKAIEILESLPLSMIRNQRKIDDTINYLNARRPYMYNYAGRKITGLVNSSNRVEDMNNQIVSRRQKNQGMSWSARGSRGLAAVTTLKVNDELIEWICYNTIRFSPNAFVKRQRVSLAA